ncbi:MAG: EF-hand domain-containing protein [archaeon]|nr:EF-hand domain-containing protein [archaeon]
MQSLGLTDSMPSIDPKQFLKYKIESQRLHELTHLSTASINSIFGDVAQDGEPTLNKDKFREAMLKHGVQLFEDPDVVDSFYAAIDKNHDGSIAKKELICALTAYSSGSLHDKLRLGFQIFDISHDGFIQPDEMKRMLLHMGTVSHTGEDLQTHVDKLVSRAFAEFDDGDGQLSLGEFIKAAEADEELRKLFTLETALAVHDPSPDQRIPIAKN